MKAIIVEDELKSLQLMETLITDFCPEVEVISTARNVADAYKSIIAGKPDIVFLDIQLEGETSFDLLNMFENEISFSIVFTTAHENYALRAIKFSAVDYIMKPIDLSELKAAVQKVAARTGKNVNLNGNLNVLMQNLKTNNLFEQRIVLSTSEGIHFIRIAEIIYCASDGPYTTFVLKGGQRVIISKILKIYEEALPSDIFYRSHNSYLINIFEVRKYVKGDIGQVLMSDGSKLDVSRSRKDMLMNKMMSIRISEV
jgi:two-component system LytT family response regulator